MIPTTREGCRPDPKNDAVSSGVWSSLEVRLGMGGQSEAFALAHHLADP